jgi:Icc-related predicted phosphoesterase
MLMSEGRYRRHRSISPFRLWAATLLFLLGVLLAPCSIQRLPERAMEREFTIWAFSDIQPRDEREKRFFEEAVADVRKSQVRFTIAIAGGDIVQNPLEGSGVETWGWYRGLLDGLSGGPVYEIAGNHDARNLPDFLAHTGRPLHYAVRYGNLLLIFLSDENPSSGTDIPDPVFSWWADLVEANQESIIVTVTHSPLKGSGFAWNFPFRRTITGSERFAEVLRRSRVDLWFFGHTHVASSLGAKTRTVEELGGTTFVNISAIREDYFLCDAESRFISLTPGRREVVVRTRNHALGAFDEAADRVVRVGVPFSYRGEAAELIAYRGPGETAGVQPAP